MDLFKKREPHKTLFKVELAKRDIIHVKFYDVSFFKPGSDADKNSTKPKFCVKKAKELHIFCIYLSYSPKDGEKRRKKVLSHLVKWTGYLSKKNTPFFIVGDFNTNFSKLPSTEEEFEESQFLDSEGIKMGKNKETPTFYFTAAEFPLL